MFAPQLLSLKTSWMLAPQSGQNHPGAIERPAPHQLADSVSERVTAPRAATVSGGTNGVAAPSSSSSKRRENSIKPSGLPQPRDWRSVENSAEEVAARSADQQREQSRNAPHSSPQKRTHGAAAAATAGTPHHQKKRNASPRMAASSGALGGATSRPQQTSNPQPNRRVVVDVSEELHDNSASSSALGEIQNNSASAGSRAAAGAPGAATASRSLHKFGSSSVQFAPPGRQSLNAWRVGAPTTSSGSKGSTSSSSSTGGQQLQHPPQVVSASYTGVGPGASVMAGTSYGGAGVLNFKYAAGTVGGAVGGAVSGELHGNWIRPAQPPMLFYQTPMPQRSVTGGQYHPMYQPPSTYQVSTVQAAAGKPFYAGSVDGVPVASSATSATSVAVAAVGAGGTGGRAPAKDSGGPAVPQGSSSHFPLHQNRQKIPPTRVVVQAVAVASDKDRQVAERTGAVPTAKAATVVVHEKTGEVHEATSAHMKRPTAAAGGRLLSHRGRSPDVGAERRRQAQARESPGKAFTMEGEIEKERRSTIHHVGGVAPFSARRSRPSVKREHSIGAQPREASFHNDSASIQEHDVMYFDVNDAQYDDDEDGKGTTTLLELQEKMHLLKAELKQAKQESSLHAKNQRLAEKKAYEARSSLTEARKEIAQCQADMRKYWEENEKLAGELGEKKKQIEQLHLKLREEKNGKHQAAREVRELQRKIETLENRERMSKMSTTCESSDSMTNLAPQSSQQPLPRHSTHVALQETPRPSQNHFAHHLQNSASGPRHATHHLQHSAGSTQKSYGNGANDSGPSSALKFKATKNVSSAQGSELSSDASQTFTSTLPIHIFLSRSMEALEGGWTRSKWLRLRV